MCPRRFDALTSIGFPAALLVGLAGCDVRSEAVQFSVLDSAGVTIAESTGPAWEAGDGWIVESTPVLDLSRTGSGSAHDFFRVTDADRLTDGSIVVADDGSDEVRVFSPSGEHVWSAGRDGSGPGEFRRLAQTVVLPGDSVLAYDPSAGRATLFDSDGALARIVTFEGPDLPRQLHPVFEGLYMGPASSGLAFDGVAGLRRPEDKVVSLGSDGGGRDTVATLPGAEILFFEQGATPPTWGKRGHLAVRDQEVYVGSADSVEFRVLGIDGHLRKIVRVAGYDLALTRAEVDSELLAWYPDSIELGALGRGARDAQPNREHRPAYASLVVDRLGYTWLQRFEARHEAGSPTKWLIFDTSGRWLGHLHLPPGFEVFRIGDDWILGKGVDEFDVEHVQVLSLIRD